MLRKPELRIRFDSLARKIRHHFDSSMLEDGDVLPNVVAIKLDAATKPTVLLVFRTKRLRDAVSKLLEGCERITKVYDGRPALEVQVSWQDFYEVVGKTYSILDVDGKD